MKNSTRMLLYLQAQKNADGTKKPVSKERMAWELRVAVSQVRFYDSLYLLRQRGAVLVEVGDMPEAERFDGYGGPTKKRGKFRVHFYTIADKKTRYELRKNTEAPIYLFEIVDLKKQRVHSRFYLDVVAKKVLDELNKNSFWF